MDAIQRLQVKLPRRIFFSHNRNLIIGERATRDGIFPTLDFVSRVREARMRSYILFTKGEAAPLLKLPPAMERYTSETIREEEKAGMGVRGRIKDFIDMLTTEGISPLGAQVAIMPEERGGKNSKQTPAIVGTAVFHRDKLAGWMNDQDTKGMLWIRNEIEKANITVTVPKEKGGGKISVQLMKGQSKVKPILEQRKVKMKVIINAEVELSENGWKLDLGNPKELYYVQTLLEKDVKKKCQLALDKGQKQLNSDIFGFGNALYRTYPKVWKAQYKKQWKEEFPNLEVSIHPHVSIVRTGLSIKTPEMKD